MLNRLYIVLGVLAILVIAGAFLVPRFIQWGEWGDYRERMEVLAGEALHAQVEILGDIEFSLLPQPQLRFTDVRVGDPESPVATVAGVEASFSLVDFLRDRYLITDLVLDQPEIRARIGRDGSVVAGPAPPQPDTPSNVSVANATIRGGTLRIADDRSGGTVEVAEIAGELRLDALQGPLVFSGTGTHGGQAYRARLGTSAFDESGGAQLTLTVGPTDDSYVVSTEGRFSGGSTPTYEGSLTLRRAPAAPVAGSLEEDLGRGALVVTGNVKANLARVLLTDYTIVPDENRPATRLSGAADITLGAGQRFNAVISGGIVALPPRAATADPGSVPYEIVRLLAEIPAAPIPGLVGTVGVDITEVNLRALSLRKVLLDATTSGDGWEVQTLTAQLPGGGTASLEGTLTSIEGRPEFSGRMALSAPRVDTVAQLWRPASAVQPLFNLPAALEADVALVGETLSLSDGVLNLGERRHTFSSEIGFTGASRHLNLNARLSEMSAGDSAALLALLPDITGDGRFAATFGRASFDIAAREMWLADLAAEDLAMTGTWEGGVLTLDAFSGNLGEVSLDGSVTAFGTVARPELSGTARVDISSSGAPGLHRFFDLVGTPSNVREWLERMLPASFDVRLDPPTGEGGQGFAANGRAGIADFRLEADLSTGVLRALAAPLSARLDVHSEDPAGLTRQLGLGEQSLMPLGEPARLVVVIEGNAMNSFATTIHLEGGTNSLGFSGNIVAPNLDSVSGNGALRFTLSDPTAITATLGAGGLSLPALNGDARLDFATGRRIGLTDISTTVGNGRVTGQLQLASDGAVDVVSGALRFDTLQPEGLLALVVDRAPAAEAPDLAGATFDLGDRDRTTTGRIAVTASAMALGETVTVAEPAFDLTWDVRGLRLRGFTGRIGDGTVSAELALCCAGALAEKQLTGRIGLTGVGLAALAPPPVAEALSANLDLAAQFSATGASLVDAVAAMSGEGNFTFSGLTVAGFAPQAFDAVASLEEVLDMEAEALAERVVQQLEAGSFETSAVSGSFTVAGGVLRSPNLAIEGEAARLFGSTTIRLSDLDLSGSFAMSPKVPSGPDGMLTEANTQIVANLSGSLPEPERSFDVTGMVDTIMVKAFEIEVARLERLRAEEEARAAAAAEEQRRIAAEEAERLAEEQARQRAAEEEAARQAAEAEAARQQTRTTPTLDFTPAQPANTF